MAWVVVALVLVNALSPDVGLKVADDTGVPAILGRQVPTGEARRVLAPHPDATAAYERDGRELSADPVSSDPTIGTPLPLGTAKLLGFRPVEPVGVCQN